MTRPRFTALAGGHLAVVLAVGGAIAVVATAILPWARSGQVRRNGFELARAADELDLIDGALWRSVLWGWFAVPALVAGVWLAATFRRRLALAALAGTVAAVALLAAGVVVASPLSIETGAWAALGAGVVTLAGALWLILDPDAGRRHD